MVLVKRGPRDPEEGCVVQYHLNTCWIQYCVHRTWSKGKESKREKNVCILWGWIHRQEWVMLGQNNVVDGATVSTVLVSDLGVEYVVNTATYTAVTE